MDDLISRQAAIDALNKMKIYRPLDSDRYVISDCLNKIVNLPSAQKKGHWVTTKSIDNEYFQMCDVCQRMASVRTNFCPNCGADMREDGETHERKQIYVEKIV